MITVPYERLEAMILALDGDGPIEPALRQEIRDALEHLHNLQLPRKPERKVSDKARRTVWDASLALELLERHAIGNGEAITAVIGKKASTQEFDRVEKQMELMRTSQGHKRVWWIKANLDFLVGRVEKNLRKSAVRRRKI